MNSTMRIAAALLASMLAVAQQRPSVIEAIQKGHAVGHEQDGIDAVRQALAAAAT